MNYVFRLFVRPCVRLSVSGGGISPTELPSTLVILLLLLFYALYKLLRSDIFYRTTMITTMMCIMTVRIWSVVWTSSFCLDAFLRRT